MYPNPKVITILWVCMCVRSLLNWHVAWAVAQWPANFNCWWISTAQCVNWSWRTVNQIVADGYWGRKIIPAQYRQTTVRHKVRKTVFRGHGWMPALIRQGLAQEEGSILHRIHLLLARQHRTITISYSMFSPSLSPQTRHDSPTLSRWAA